MFDTMKRLVPSPLKQALRRSLGVLEQGDELRQRIRQLEEHIDALQARVFELSPEIIEPSEAVRQAVADLLRQKGLPAGQVNLNISRNDLMYQFIARKHKSLHQGYMQYFRSGMHMMEVLQAIVRHKFCDPGTLGAFLDFGSGYGRLTRFLMQAIAPGRIWVSDIKARAVQFQQEQFGVQGLLSSESPEGFSPVERFDCIFVGSLFSHLPQPSFGRWLKQLDGVLSPDGLVIFTVNDVSLLGRPEGRREKDFVFLHSSEETMLRSADEPLDTNQYGSAFVNEMFVLDVLGEQHLESRRFARYKRGMWGRQDLYILSRNSGDDLSGLTLPGGYPR
jgi:SAM-dependent methyltransferase